MLAFLGSSLSSLLLSSGPPALPPDTRAPVAETEAGAEPAPTEPTEPGDELSAVPPEPEAPGPAPLTPAEPVPPSPSPLATPLTDFESPEGLRDQIEPGFVLVERPRYRGTGLFIGAGAFLGAAITFQLSDGLGCGNCAIGVIERVFLGHSMALAAGAGVMRAHADAYDDTALRRERPSTRRALIAGATLTGVGAVLGLVNEGLWWRCAINESGPYQRDDGEEFSFGLQCNHELARGLLDVAAMSTATGLGLLSWSLTYRRDAKAYERSRVIGLRPTLGRNRVTLALEGRF